MRPRRGSQLLAEGYIILQPDKVPPGDTEGVPLNNFGILLEFSETVQAGDSYILVKDGTNSQVPTWAELPCERDSTSPPYFEGKYAIVPVNVELRSAGSHMFIIPYWCFKSALNDEPMTRTSADYILTAITKGDDIFAYDLAGPTLLSFVLVTPPPHETTTLNSTQTQTFTLFFSEAVQRGIAPVQIVRTSLTTGEATVFDAHPTIELNADDVFGKVIIDPIEMFTPGAEYECFFGDGAFLDLAGNSAVNSRDLLGVSDGWKVRVMSHPIDGSDESMAFAVFPPATYPVLDGRNVTPYTNLIFEFDNEVAPGRGAISFCFNWSTWPDETGCGTDREDMPAREMFFFGNTVMVNPGVNMEFLSTVNVSIPEGVIRGFYLDVPEGIFWYQIQVMPNYFLDTEPPTVFRALVDCNGDGDHDDECDTDGDGMMDFSELTGVLDATTGHQPLPRTAQIRLYYPEPVKLVTDGPLCSIRDEDTSLTLAVAYQEFPAIVGTDWQDCVVVLAPEMRPGRRYAVTLPPGTLRDTAGYPGVPNVDPKGLVFRFHVPMPPPEVQFAANGLTGVARTSLIRLVFEITPMLPSDFEERELLLECVDDCAPPERIPFGRYTQVKQEGREFTIIPGEHFVPGMTYRLFVEKFTFRFMHLDLDVNFTVRPSDSTPPSIVLPYPRGDVSKRELDTHAPYVLFSEGVEAAPDKYIRIRESGILRYVIAANDTDCGLEGTPEDACALLDLTDKQLTIYPTGMSAEGGPAVWATEGLTYTVHFDEGAFTDAITTGHTDYNGMAQDSYAFYSLPDASGPLLVSSDPPDQSGSFSPSAIQVTLEFDEAIQAGDNSFSIRHWRETFDAPAIVGMDGAPAPLSTEHPVVTLTFDTMVQAGALDATFEVYHAWSGDPMGPAVTVSNATFMSNTVTFAVPINDSTPLVPGEDYYVRSSSADAVLGSTGLAMMMPVDTFPLVPYRAAQYPLEPTITTLDGYACMQAAGLPDIDLVMVEGVVAVSARGRKAHLYRCNGPCPGEGEEDNRTLLWSVPLAMPVVEAENYTAQPLLDPHLLVQNHSEQSFFATLGTGALPAEFLGSTARPLEVGFFYHLELDAGLFEDGPSLIEYYEFNTTAAMTTGGPTTTATTTELFFNCSNNSNSADCNFTFFDDAVAYEMDEAWGGRRLYGEAIGKSYIGVAGSPTIRLPFYVCDAMFDWPREGVVHLYAEALQSSVAKSYLVSIPPAAVMDELGNTPNFTQEVEFRHELIPPVLEPDKSSPRPMEEASPQSNLVLVFDEVIQFGTGYFEIWECGTGCNISFDPFPELPEILDIDYNMSYNMTTNETFETITTSTTEPESVTNATYTFENATNETNETLENKTNTTEPGNSTLFFFFTMPPSTNETNETEWNETNESNTTNFVFLPTVPTTTTTTLDPGVLRFLVDVATIKASSVAGHSLIANRSISITPKTLCSEASPMPCEDLKAYRAYYVKTSIPGVILDATGNRLAPLDTMLSLAFPVFPDPLRAPSVAFVGGSELTRITEQVTRLVGYVFFDEQITAAPEASGRGGPVVIEDCGPRFLCAELDDIATNSSSGVEVGCSNASFTGEEAFLVPTDITYGDGSQRGGESEYGMLRFEEFLPMYNRRYRITICADRVRDAFGSDAGPPEHFSYELDVGPQVPPYATETGRPYVLPAGYFPANGTIRVPSDTAMLQLYFNEDIQHGGGQVRLCTNADAQASAPDSCDPARYADGSEVVINATDLVIRRRILKILFVDALYPHQEVFLVMDEGVVLDTDPGRNPMDAIEGAEYGFTVEDLDMDPPELQYVWTPALVADGPVTLLFSEAVQFAEGATVEVSDANGTRIYNYVDLDVLGASPVTASLSIEGNEAVVDAQWEAGGNYSLDDIHERFTDLVGRGATSNLNLTFFSIDSDTERPTVTPAPEHMLVGGVHAYETMMLEFDEVVQAVDGAVLVHSAPILEGCVAEWCGEQLLASLDASSLPLVNYRAGGRLRSGLFIDPGIRWRPNVTYSVQVTASAFEDAAGNAFHELAAPGMYSVDGAWLQDKRVPTVLFVDTGFGGSPNPRFNTSTLVLYFSEAVQVVTGGYEDVTLEPSTGGDNCGTSTPGACEPGEECSQPCGYTQATSIMRVTNENIAVDGAVVTLSGFSSLQEGKGYKLMIDTGKFRDVAGNPTPDFNGEQQPSSNKATCVFRRLMNFVHEDSIGPVLESVLPLPGELSVQPSTTVHLTFDEAVQAGSGSVVFLDSHGETAVSMPASDCKFWDSSVTCKPPHDLARFETYSVTIDADAARDIAGNDASQGPLAPDIATRFTTIDADFTPPVLGPAGGTSYAVRRLEAMPMDPYREADNVAKASLLALTFSENVQAGSGSLVMAACTTLTGPGEPCAAAGAEAELDVQGDQEAFFFQGSTVYMKHGELEQGTTYEVSTLRMGVFTDVAHRPFEAMHAGFRFNVIPDDLKDPTVFFVMPRNDVYDMDDSVTSDVFLYFNEAVQATGLSVTVSGGNLTRVIPTDNSEPLQGQVYIQDQLVTINPNIEFAYNTTVSVHVPPGVFADLHHRPFAGVPESTYMFRTIEATFETVRSLVPYVIMRARWGALLHFLNGTYLMRGGMGENGTCLSDSWRSENGTDWYQVWGVESTDYNRPPPSAGNCASAQNMWGCVFLTAGECAADPSTVWRSCDTGMSWEPLDMDYIIVPFNETIPPLELPVFKNHGIAVVNGWQVVIVDAADATHGSIWRYVDKEAKHIQLVMSAPLPFGPRKDPRFVAMGDGTLYLFGGHRCDETAPLCPDVLADLWATRDAGVTWECITAHYNPAGTTGTSMGASRYSSIVATGDDTIWVMGGHVANTSAGSNLLFSSYEGPRDEVAPRGPNMTFPVGQSLVRTAHLSIFFSEGIQATSLEGVHLMDLGINGTFTSMWAEHYIETGADVEIERQMLTFLPHEPLLPGHRYGYTVPSGALHDMAGNSIGAMHGEFDITASNDTIPPVIEAMLPSNGTESVPSWTTITLLASEPVMHGSGMLVMTPKCGSIVTVNVSTAIIVAHQVFFPSSGARLTAGQQYTLTVTSGMLLDLAGNPLENATVGHLTILSGNYTSNDYFAPVAPLSDELLDFDDVNFSWAAERDTIRPVLHSVHPPPFATDVPARHNMSIQMLFSEPVVFSQTGVINFRTGYSLHPDSLIDTLDLSNETERAYIAKFPPESGARIYLPNRPEVVDGVKLRTDEPMLMRGHWFRAEIPRGAIVDLAGNEVDSMVTIEFDCLGELMDTTPPFIVMQDPPQGAVQVPGTTPRIELYMSEKVERLQGSIMLKRPKPSSHRRRRADLQADAVFDIPGPNVVFDGWRVTVELFEDAISEGGETWIEIEADSMQDIPFYSPAGYFEGGLNGIVGFSGSDAKLQTSFTTFKDQTPPTWNISDQYPSFEVNASFALPTTTALVLEFSEPVQAGPGVVRLRPRFSSPVVEIPAMGDLSSGIAVAGNRVYVTPPDGLMPGEVYTVEVEPDAIRDLNFLNFVPPEEEYFFSTAPLMRFRQVGEEHWADPDPSYQHDGRRFGMAVAVDARNNILVMGGHNGTEDNVHEGAIHGNFSVLNDIHRFVTLRETDCASAFIEAEPCNEEACIPKGDGSDEHTLGTRRMHEVVVRAPARACKYCKIGVQCPTAPGFEIWDTPENESEVVNYVGQVLSEADDTCVCPHCMVAPGPPQGPPLPLHMAEPTSYVEDYVLVTAANGRRPLLCGPGRVPTNDFVCQVYTRYFGRYYLPYPTCVNASCYDPPDTDLVPHFAEFDWLASSYYCLNLTAYTFLRHGESCAIRCEAGWYNQDVFICIQGEFQLPSCHRQPCTRLVSGGGELLCDGPAGPDAGAVMGQSCTVRCVAGWTPETPVVNCTTDNTEPEWAPDFVPAFPSCVPSFCGDFLYMEGTVITYSSPDRVTGDLAVAECMPGYVLWNRTSTNLFCGAVRPYPGATAVEWKSQENGRAAGPICVAEGEGVSEHVEVEGTLTFTLNMPPSLTSQQLCTNRTFNEMLALSLSAALIAVAEWPMPVSTHHEVRLASCGDGRRLSTLDTSLSYRVNLTDAWAGADLLWDLEDDGTRAHFAWMFASAITKSTGIAASGPIASIPSVLIEYISYVLTTTTPPTPAPEVVEDAESAPIEKKGANVVAIVLGILIGLLVVTLTGLVLRFLWLRRQLAKVHPAGDNNVPVRNEVDQLRLPVQPAGTTGSDARSEPHARTRRQFSA